MNSAENPTNLTPTESDTLNLSLYGRCATEITETYVDGLDDAQKGALVKLVDLHDKLEKQKNRRGEPRATERGPILGLSGAGRQEDAEMYQHRMLDLSTRITDALRKAIDLGLGECTLVMNNAADYDLETHLREHLDASTN